MGRKKLDKIFNNTFEEQEYDKGSQNFKIEQGYESSTNPEEYIHDKLLFDEIHEIVEDSEYKYLNEFVDKDDDDKLNKVQINEIYSFISEKIGSKYRKIEIWSTLSDYFNIYPNKFYSSLSNIYKDDLLTELNESTGYWEKNNMRKLF